MIVLTRIQKRPFIDAFNCISRVAAMHYSVDSINEIKISHDRSIRDLPDRYLELLRTSGSLYNLSKVFNDGSDRQKNLQRLIDKCYAEQIQPGDYIFYGLLVKKKMNVEVFTYADEAKKVSA